MAPVRARQQLEPEQQRAHALADLVVDGVIDWSPWYLSEEEDMSQGTEQGEIIDALVSSLRTLAAERNWQSVYVGHDTFFAWVPDQPLVQVSPDVYLLHDVHPRDHGFPRRWETWRADQSPPGLAIEIVSTEWRKDYHLNPGRYDHLGAAELVIADPEPFANPPAPGRVPFQVFRRNRNDVLERVHEGPGPVYCAEIDSYLCFRRQSDRSVQVRVSRDAAGQDIVPTAGERVHTLTTQLDAQASQLQDQTAQLDAQATQLDTQATQLDAQAAELDALRARLRKLENS